MARASRLRCIVLLFLMFFKLLYGDIFGLEHLHLRSASNRHRKIFADGAKVPKTRNNRTFLYNQRLAMEQLPRTLRTFRTIEKSVSTNICYDVALMIKGRRGVGVGYYVG